MQLDDGLNDFAEGQVQIPVAIQLQHVKVLVGGDGGRGEGRGGGLAQRRRGGLGDAAIIGGAQVPIDLVEGAQPFLKGKDHIAQPFDFQLQAVALDGEFPEEIAELVNLLHRHPNRAFLRLRRRRAPAPRLLRRR